MPQQLTQAHIKQIAGGQSNPSKTVTAKIDFHEEPDHKNDHFSARIEVTNADIWDFSVNGDVSNNGCKTVGVEFKFSFD